METVDLLQRIGLNKYEAEAYYTLLVHGSLTGYEVGKYSHVPLSRSYEILERLLEKGLALVQPGEPPRYSAQEPELVLDRFYSAMETTLDALATSLAALARIDTKSEFWVVRGQQNILAQIQALIGNAHTTLDLVLPANCPVAESISRARERGCRVYQILEKSMESASVLLMRDTSEVLVGTMTALDSCQVVVSANAVLLGVVQAYFSQLRAPEHAIPAEPAVASSPSRDTDWLDWEVRKQRHLQSLSANRVA